jgi:hypothetical protein
VYDVPRFDFNQHTTQPAAIEWLVTNHPPVQMYVEQTAAEVFADEVVAHAQPLIDYEVRVLPDEVEDAPT